MKPYVRRFAVLSIYLLCGGILFAQLQPYRIFFTDKGDSVFLPGSPLYEATLQLYTPRALKRRAKVRPVDSLLTLQDAPVAPRYVQTVMEFADTLLMRSRWFNYVVVLTDSLRIHHIAALPFVRKIQPVASKFTPQSPYQSVVFPAVAYGPAFHQLALLNIPFLHTLGIDGTGILIGVTDTGFRTDHVAFQHLHPVATYDFIQRDTIVAWEPGDPIVQPEHGSAVLSVLAGYYPDSLIGAAYNAQYVLAKTEDLRWERHIEEDHYLEALEWFDRLGVDVVSTSLGYRGFDAPEYSYSAQDLDGRTTLVAQAVNLAVARGMIVVAAAGNSGNAPHSILSPADADSVIAVAALRPDGTPAGFSSRGPRVDGVLRPTIAAQGVAVRCIDARTTDRFSYGGGTSLATPLISGGIALMLSAFPELTPWQIRSLLYTTASQATHPDPKQGYGLANFLAALNAYDILLSPHIFITRLDSGLFRIGTFAYSSYAPLQLVADCASLDSLWQQSFAMEQWGNAPFFYFDLATSQLPPVDSLVVQFVATDPFRQRQSRPHRISLHPTTYPHALPKLLPQFFPAQSIRLSAIDNATLLVDLPALTTPVHIALYGFDGRRLLSTVFSTPLPSPQLLRLPPMSPGSYVLHLWNADFQQSFLLIVPNHSGEIVIIPQKTENLGTN